MWEIIVQHRLVVITLIYVIRGDFVVGVLIPVNVKKISSFLARNSNICAHKSLRPLQWQDILLFVLLFIADFFNTGSGSLVPLLIYLGGFTTQESVALVNAIITGNAITIYLLNLRSQDPTTNQPTVQYDVSMAIQPMSIVGTIIGVAFNSVFPDPNFTNSGINGDNYLYF